MTKYDLLLNEHPPLTYYNEVFDLLRKIECSYKYFRIILLPTLRPTLIGCEIIAVNNTIINSTHATKFDLTNEFSKEVWIVIPTKYKTNGCDVYGGEWIDETKIDNDSKHFYKLEDFSFYKFCVGIDEEMAKSKNIVLENIKTIENVLVEYEKMMVGLCKSYEGLHYSHGLEGIYEYRRKNKKL